MICRCRFVKSTTSKSTIPRVPTPAAARYNPSGAPSLAPCGPVASPRNHGAGAPAAREDIWGSLPELYHKQYRSLFRLAVFAYGLRRRRGAVVLDSFAAVVPPAEAPAAEDDALPHAR